MAVAPDGTVLIAARFATEPDLIDMRVAKSSPGGRKVWSRIADRDGLDRVRDVAVAPDGGIYLAGEKQVGKFSPSGRLASKPTWLAGIHAAAASRDGGHLDGAWHPSGSLLWSTALHGPGSGADEGLAVATAPGGAVLAGAVGSRSGRIALWRQRAQSLAAPARR